MPKAASTAARGSYAVMVHIDNRTRWYVDVVVDGVNVGTVTPFGDLYEAIPAGSTRISAIAHFDGGTSVAWGPDYYNLVGNLTWYLR